VGEQMVAFVLATEFLRKFGGDSIDDFEMAVVAYRQRVAARTGG
jgi:hypothetical protein